VAPCSPWPQDARLKRIGKYGFQNILELIKSGGLLLRAGGMEPNDIEQLQAAVAKECLNSKNHPYGIVLVQTTRQNDDIYILKIRNLVTLCSERSHSKMRIQTLRAKTGDGCKTKGFGVFSGFIYHTMNTYPQRARLINVLLRCLTCT
jgi:hypothetical protein